MMKKVHPVVVISQDEIDKYLNRCGISLNLKISPTVENPTPN